MESEASLDQNRQLAQKLYSQLRTSLFEPGHPSTPATLDISSFAGLSGNGDAGYSASQNIIRIPIPDGNLDNHDVLNADVWPVWKNLRGTDNSGLDNSGFVNVVLTYGTAPGMTSFGLTPSLVSVGGSQQIDFDVSLRPGVTATVTITYLNQDSVSVLRTITVTGQGSGHVTRTWDTRSDDGYLVAAGSYLVTVSVTDTLGNTVARQLIAHVQY